VSEGESADCGEQSIKGQSKKYLNEEAVPMSHLFLIISDESIRFLGEN
jgi:hypothetical protein